MSEDRIERDAELAADVEKDDKVDIKDLRKILRYVCGKLIRYKRYRESDFISET